MWERVKRNVTAKYVQDAFMVSLKINNEGKLKICKVYSVEQKNNVHILNESVSVYSTVSLYNSIQF